MIWHMTILEHLIDGSKELSMVLRTHGLRYFAEHQAINWTFVEP